MIRKLAGKVLSRIGSFCLKTSTMLYQSPQERRVLTWFEHSGDKTLRLNYDDLTETSLVFDLGGYEGQWASDIFAKYSCCVWVFEPVHAFAEQIEKRFANNRKIVVHRFGLGNETRRVKIALMADGSSTFGEGNDFREILLMHGTEFFKDKGISHIDLMKINIEGGEYELLEHLIESGFIRNIKNIQVQFHDFVPHAETRMHSIQQNLVNSHELTYQYPFVWENWRVKTY